MTTANPGAQGPSLPRAPAPAAPRHRHRVRGKELRRSLRLVSLTSLIAGVFFAAIMGACFPLLAGYVGLSDRLFGITASLPAATAVLQLPGAILLARYGKRKWVMIYTAVAHRLLWIPIATVPLIFGDTALAVVLFMSFIALDHAVGHISGLAWQSWMSDLVPARRRSTFFSARGRIFHASMLVASLATGWFLGLATSQSQLIWSLWAVYTFAAVVGVTEMIGYARTADDEPPPRPATDWLASLLVPIRDARFRPILIYGMFLAAGIGILGPFLWKHVLVSLNLPKSQATLILQSTPIFAVILVGPWWGKCIDRIGGKATLLTSTIGGSLVSLGWFWVTPEHWWLGIAFTALGQLLWTGVDSSIFNMVLRFTSRGRSGVPGGGPAYTAVYAVCTASAAFVVGSLSGQIAESLHTAAWPERVRVSLSLPSMSPYLVLLGLSVMIRLLAAAFVLPRIKRDVSMHTRKAVGVLVGQAYSSFTQMIERPWNEVTKRLPFLDFDKDEDDGVNDS